MRTFAIANSKGGSGKTTTAIAMAAAAAKAGSRVLLIDLDAQGTASYYTKADTSRPGSHALLMGKPVKGLIQTTAAGFDIIPASWQLSTVQASKGSGSRLQQALKPLHSLYDVCFVDLPPQLGELQINGLMAADGLIIALQAATGDLQGLHQMADVCRQIQQTGNPNLKPTGIIVTRYKGTSKLARFMQQTIADTAAGYDFPLLATIPETVAVQEAQAVQQSLLAYCPNGKAAIAYQAAWEAIK